MSGCKLKQIKFGELKFSEDTIQEVVNCLRSDHVTMGSKVAEFEDKFKQLFRYKHCVLMNSGTSADMAAFMTLYENGAKQGDEIICPALTFVATWNAIRAAGFIPKPVDIRMDLNIDVDEIEGAITDKTVAICAVNLMGRPAKLDEIQYLCRKYNLKFIVDNCEAYGSVYKNSYSLDYCDIETTSHFIAHCCAFAEGGCCFTNDPKLDRLLRMIRSHGREPHSQYFDHKVFGLNFKNTDIHAALGLGELTTFWPDFNIRMNNLAVLINHTKKYGHLATFTKEDDEDFGHAPHAFNIILNKPEYNINKLCKLLDDNLIEWKRTFGAISQQRCMDYLRYKAGSFPIAEYVGENSIHLGVHKFLTHDDLHRICVVLDEFFGDLC